jgi:hypothetical protein
MKKRKTGAKPVTVSLPELQGGWSYVFRVSASGVYRF